MAGLNIQIKKSKAGTVRLQVAEALEVDYHELGEYGRTIYNDTRA